MAYNKYSGFERRQDTGWKLTKTFDVGTIITFTVLLMSLIAMSNKLENRLTAVEIKIQMLMDQRFK